MTERSRLDEARERTAQRLASGVSREELIAETLDAKSIDAMKIAVSLGIWTPKDGRTWAAGMALHLADFARRHAHLSREEVRQLVEAALATWPPAQPTEDLARWRLNRLQDLAEDVLGAGRVHSWLVEANPWLDGRSPREVAAESDKGLDQVLHLLARIRDGTYT